jgi:hypothetical protein
VLRNSLLQQGFRDQPETAGIERFGHRAVEIRAQRDVLGTDDSDSIANGCCDRLGIDPTGGEI